MEGDDFAPFESPKLLIQGAKEGITEFEAACARFIKRCDYDIIYHTDIKTGEKVCKFRFRQRLPGGLRLTAYRIVNDLRHSLDQAVCDGAVRLGRANSKGVYFPFGRLVDDFDREIKSRCRNVDSELVAFIRSFNAYYGGDQELYMFGNLAGPNKHQRILRVSLSSTQGVLQSKGLYMRGPLTFGTHKWNEFHNEVEVARVSDGGYIHADYRPTLEIVIGTGEAPLHGPAPAVFNRLAGKIEGIVLGIEAEADRIMRSRG